MVYHVDEQTMIAIKVMYDRVGNSSKVADFFELPTKTAWRYACHEDHDRRAPNYDVARNREERKVKMKKLRDFMKVSLEYGGQARLARQLGCARQQITGIMALKKFPRRKRVSKILEILNAPDTLRRVLGANQ
jgi:hypothetical protein